MDFNAEYEPSTWQWVADQVAEYEESGGQRANTLMDTGIPIIIFTTIGRSSGKLRKVPLMRVEHESEYALVAPRTYSGPIEGFWGGEEGAGGG